MSLEDSAPNQHTMTSSDHPEIVRDVATVMLALSWVAVSLRVYVRSWLTNQFNLADWLAVASLAVFTIHCSFVFTGLTYRFHQPPTLDDIVAALQWWWAASLPYIACTALIKATVGIFLLRFCASRRYVYVIYSVLCIFVAYNTAYFFICVFQCSPIDHFWMQLKGSDGTCIGRHVLTRLSYVAAGLNAAADVILGVLPIFLVRKLQISLASKISIAIVLAIGSVSVISTLVRLPYLVTLLETIDFLNRTTPVAVWGLLELGLGLTAASVVTLKPLFNLWFKGEQPYNRRNASTSSSYGKRYFHRHDVNEIIRSKGERSKRDSVIELTATEPPSMSGVGVASMERRNDDLSRQLSV